MAEKISVGPLDFYLELRASGEDGGPTVRIHGQNEGRDVQIFRFDMFRREPHYHYDPNGKDIRYYLDPLTLDDGIGWVMSLLRNKLPQMLEKAGCESAVGPSDIDKIVAALPEIEQRWRDVTRTHVTA